MAVNDTTLSDVSVAVLREGKVLWCNMYVL